MPGKSKSKSSHVFATKKRTQKKRNQTKPTSPSKFPESSKQNGNIEIGRQSSGQLMQEDTVASSPGLDQVACNTGIERVDDVSSGVEGDEPAPSTKHDSPGAGDRGCGSSTPIEDVEPLRNASEDTKATQSSLDDIAQEDHASVLVPSSTPAPAASSDDWPSTKRVRGTAIEVAGLTTLPPAFMPGYTDERVLSRTEPIEDNTPAYARSSHSYWFRHPANKLAQEKFARAESAGPLRSSEPKLKAAPLSDPSVPECSRKEVEIEGGRTQDAQNDSSTDKGISSGISSAAIAPNAPTMSIDASYESSPEEQDKATVLDPSPNSASTLHSGTTQVEDAAALSYPPLQQADYVLLGATLQNPGDDVIIWFDREPIAPIDADFSDDEEDESTSEGLSTSRSLPMSSSTSQSSIEDQMDRTFLGSTCARDFSNHLHHATNDMVSKKQVAEAWVLCAAAEDASRRSGSQPDTLLWDFYITERDASRALEVQMQRRAKLDSVSLRDFLKKFQFDRDCKTMASMVMSAFCETAVASRARVL
jgi:hypothetical protein